MRHQEKTWMNAHLSTHGCTILCKKASIALLWCVYEEIWDNFVWIRHSGELQSIRMMTLLIIWGLFKSTIKYLHGNVFRFRIIGHLEGIPPGGGIWALKLQLLWDEMTLMWHPISNKTCQIQNRLWSGLFSAVRYWDSFWISEQTS